jgi:hypothetical protein
MAHTMTFLRSCAALALAFTLSAQSSSAQAPARDASARLREVLPADVAQRVLAKIAEARAQQLPADALQNRALKFAAKGVDPKSIELSVNEQAARMQIARAALASGRASAPAGDEIEAGAEAIRKGVDGPSINSLAKSAPSGRSLAVPLFVVGSLRDRGLSSSDALQRVLAHMKADASDTDLEGMPGDVAASGATGQGNRPASTGRDFGQSHKPASAGRPANAGPPSGVPGNGGSNRGRGHKPPKKN